MNRKAVMTELSACRVELENAADVLLAAAERGIRSMRDLNIDPADCAPVMIAFAAVAEACAFHDLTCQRLQKVERLVNGGAVSSDAEGLLNGPAAKGQGLDQDAADALFAGAMKA